MILQADTANSPLRVPVEGFAATFTVKVALPDPPVGDIEIHGEKEVTIQSILQIIDTGAVVEPEGTNRDTGDVTNTTPVCVTVIFAVIPPPDTLTVPLRELIEEFAITVTVTVASPAPLEGETVIQPASSLTFQG
jgi:hypothetical protein